MAYPNPPLNIAAGYTAGNNISQINAAATDLVWKMQKENTRKYEVSVVV